MNATLSYNVFLFTQAHAALAACAIVFSELVYVLPTIVIIYVFANYPPRKAFSFSVLFLITIAVACGGAWFLKNIFIIPRPFVTLGFTPLIAETGYSFPSMHAAVSGAIALGLVFAFPKRSWFSFFIVLFSLAITLSRVMLGVHYFGDVIVGFAFGALVAWGVHIIFTPRKHLVR